jgi:hypothetical protein
MQGEFVNRQLPVLTIRPINCQSALDREEEPLSFKALLLAIG